MNLFADTLSPSRCEPISDSRLFIRQKIFVFNSTVIHICNPLTWQPKTKDFPVIIEIRDFYLRHCYAQSSNHYLRKQQGNWENNALWKSLQNELQS